MVEQTFSSLEEKVSCEIMKLPSMMWKRSIVQARGLRVLGMLLLMLLTSVPDVLGAELVIEIPGAGGEGSYRLDYSPPDGSPAPNFTVPARAATINFQGLPGTKYHFMLYYSNDTFADLLTWNQTIITAPEPPTNLTVALGRNKQATINWSPPAHGNYTGFRFKVVPLTERLEGGTRNVSVDGSGNWSLVLRELAPGATYALHASTLLIDKESAAYASTNFTTKPNTPGKFIVWFRNETTLLVLWQPPYPPGFYTHYKVSIVPPDARESELYVEKEGEPPGPAQAAFKGLVPGRAYNISVQTVSETCVSQPTTAQYRTVPLRVRNVTVLLSALAERSAAVVWQPPPEHSEFEKYQVSVSGARRLAPIVRARNETPVAHFEQLEPGQTYQVTVKTMSGKVTSWPATVDITLKPLPVKEVKWRRVEGSDAILVWWTPDPASTQDHYKVSYHEAGPSRDDSSALTAAGGNITLDALLPGRNYTIAVCAVSRGVEGAERVSWAVTRPLAPVLRGADAGPGDLRLAWSSDVNSRQEQYELRYRRHEEPQQAGKWTVVETEATHATLLELIPGAAYELQLCAVSHRLRSDVLAVLRPVRPLPAEWVVVERASSSSALVRWAGPARGAVGHYSLRYRAEGGTWTRAPPLPPTERRALLSNLTHGANYTVQLDTMSEPAPAPADALPSLKPLLAWHAVRPNPVSNVAALVDTRNMTLEWPRPEGVVQYYSISWGDASVNLTDTQQEAGGGAGGAGGSRLVRAHIGPLQPGAAYTVAIAAHAHALSSDVFSMDTRTRPLIQSEMTIVTESGDDDDNNDTMPSFLVIYTRTPASASVFDSYRFRLEADAEPPRTVERRADAAGQQVRFTQLVPGRLYNVTMWSVSHNVTSHPVQRQARLYPRPVTNLTAVSVGAREVSLAWEAPRGDYTDFEVQYLAARDRLASLATPRAGLLLRDLQPHTLYTFTVETRAGAPGALLTRSVTASLAVRTREAAPGAARRFAPVDAAPARVTFAWELPPAERHGVLTRFVVDYNLQGDPNVVSQEFPPDAEGGTVSGLRPGATYEFRLRAESGAGAGPPALWTQHMAIGAPPPPPPAAAPAQVRRASTAAAVRFENNYFSNANGNITAYTLVLAEEPRNQTPARLPSWRDVQALSVWPPYQVTEPYDPFVGGAVTAEEFTLGGERCEASARRYCNGPLKPNTKYYVKLRAFTAPDKFTDTGYAVLYTDPDNTAYIAGGAAAALAALLAGAALLLLRRRRGARASPAAPPAPRLSRPVRVADFIDHYRLMSADSDFRFSEEFEELKHVGREQPCTAADLPVNRPKNRFTNILPYDHSRFKLQPVDDEEGSDYINANYVPGHHGPREFIVTQGPLHSTRDDFWRMCWESGSRAVVMLTRCVEKGREKCDRYWPVDARPALYGDIAVTVLNESRLPDWTVSELLLSRGAETRVLLHFHFTTWPDFGVPEPPTTLCRFVRAFRERCADARPVVVHCSAGVGRSGTFITLDRALQQLATRGANATDTIDIFGMVAAMRRERVWMVQTEQQYICIHQCLVAVLEGRDLAPPPHHHLNPAFDDDEGIAESGM